MFCNNCGKEVVKDAVFCPNCGNNIKQVNELVNNVVKKEKKQINKSLLLIICIAVLAIVSSIIVVTKVLKNKRNNEFDKYGTNSGMELVTTINSEHDIPKFIDGKFTSVRVTSTSDAFLALDSIKEQLKIKDVNKEFIVESSNETQDGNYFRLHQQYNDVPIYGANLIISTDTDGNVQSLSGYYIPNIDIDTNEKITKEELEQIVMDVLGNDAKVYSSEKYILQSNELVYLIVAYNETGGYEYMLDANTGEIIDTNEIIDSVAKEVILEGINGLQTVTVDYIYDDQAADYRYHLYDPTRNILINDYSGLGVLLGLLFEPISKLYPIIGDINGNTFIYNYGVPASQEISKIGITALKNFEDIYDYYNMMGSKSYDNKGSKIVVNIGVTKNIFTSEQYDNACWHRLTNEMYIGYENGISYAISKDVLAHEYTHGIIQHTAKFVSSPEKDNYDKAFETGALNEGIADIMGSLIEGKNWIMGEDIDVIRDLSNPLSKSDPIKRGGEHYYPDYWVENNNLDEYLKKLHEKYPESVLCDDHAKCYDKGGVHTNATVVGHAAYLMFTNGAFESMKEMAKVWYNALFLMPSNSSFEDAALAVLQAAKNLGLSAKSIRIIELAFIETNMLESRKIVLDGTVTSGSEQLSGVTIKLVSKTHGGKDYTLTTDEEGYFITNILNDSYEIIISKENFEEYKDEITINGDTTLNIELLCTKKIANEDNDNIINMNCTSNNCHILTVYFMEGANTGIKENYQKYKYEHGTIMGVDTLVNAINSNIGTELIKISGDSFVISVGGFDVDFAYYYKDTDKIFSFDTPINEDIAIEMKLFGGLLDNNFFENMSEFFNF